MMSAWLRTHTKGKLRGRTEGSSKEAEESSEEPCNLYNVVWPLSQALCKTSLANKSVRWTMQELRHVQALPSQPSSSANM